MNKTMIELITCAIEQGYSIKIGKEIYIDLLVYLNLKEIEGGKK